LATPVKFVANLMKSQAEPPKQTRFNLHPPASRYATRTMRSTVSTVCKATAGVSVYTRNDVPKLDPQSRIAPAPTPHSRIKRSVPPTSETLKPQRDALDFIFIRDASVGTQPDRPCGREGSTLNRMDPVQMRMSRAQPKAVDCVSDATNRYLREWQANSYKSDSSCPNRANVYVREAPTNYRRNPRKQVKAADSPYSYFLNSDYSDEYYYDYDEYPSDPDLDYTDTLLYHPGISNRSSCSSGAFQPGVSPQPGNFQPKRGAW
jgi:hypothetical protein